MSFCPNCGANVGDSLFCGFCGTKIINNEKVINSTDQIDKTEQTEEIRCDEAVHQNSVEYEPVIDEQKSNIFDQVVEDQLKPQSEKNIQSETDIYSIEKEPHPCELEDGYSSTLSSKEKVQHATEDLPEQNNGVHIRKQNDVSDIKEKRTPKTRKKKVLTIILCILLSAIVIASSAIVGLYIKPKTDLYIIANAIAKTVFQSGSFNFNVDEVDYYYNEETDMNYNGCVIWNDNVKNSYLYIYSGDDDDLYSIIKFENGYWKESYDGYEFDTLCRGLPTDLATNIPADKFESTSIDEDGFESFVDYAVIPFVNDELAGYWKSSLDSLSAKQAIEIITDMISDEDFNKKAIEIDKKDEVNDGIEYSLTVDINSLIKACWNYLKTSDIYTVLLDNSENREELDRKMNDYFENEDFSGLILKLDITIDNDGYINALNIRTGSNYNDGFKYEDTGYRAELYNFGMAEKQG